MWPLYVNGGGPRGRAQPARTGATGSGQGADTYPFEAWALRPYLTTAQGAEARVPQAHRDYNASRVHSSIGRVPPD